MKVDGGYGLGVGAEYQVRPRLGIEASLTYLQSEMEYMLDLDEEWGMDEDDYGWFALTIGANFHLTDSDSKADLYIGPLVGWADLGEADFNIFGERLTGQMDNEFVYGAQIGIDVPACPAGCWMFHAGLRYMALEVDPDFGRLITVPENEELELEVGMDPIILMFGASYRF